MKYRKKPVVIEAIQLCWKNWDEVCDFIPDLDTDKYSSKTVESFSDKCGEESPFVELTIKTLEGDMTACHGDFIIKGVQGELYPCKPDIFEATYEQVED